MYNNNAVAMIIDTGSLFEAANTTINIYRAIVNQPCHKAGVQPQPYNFLLNQRFSGLSFK